MSNKVYDGIVKDLDAIVVPGVKRYLKMLIKERKEKEQKMTVADDMATIKGHYLSYLNILFEKFSEDALIDGLVRFSGYQEPKEEE